MQRTPAPFAFTENSRGWVVFKDEGGIISEAWGCEAGGASVVHEKSAAATGLKSRIEGAGGSCSSIPSSWRALPTGMDLQVHLRFPGQDSKELLEGGLDSALAGGFDSILTMPNTNPFLDNPAVLKHAKEAADLAASNGRWPVTVLFSAAGSVDMKGGAATDIAGLVRAGAVAITDDGWGVASDAVMEEIFKRCAVAGVPFLQHAEIPGHKGVTPASEFQRREGLTEYPRNAESGMVARDVALLRKVKGARYHVLHISTRDTLKEIEKAKNEGLEITCEVTPHHLFFSNAEIPPGSDPRTTNYKMNPPLFDPEDREALISALESGLVNFVSTDHAPHEAANKAKGWMLSPFGTRGLVTALPVLMTLVSQGKLSWKRLEEVYSTAARKFIGVPSVAQPSGVLFVDPTARWRVSENDLPGISKNSCFLGAELVGRIEKRGEKTGVYTRTP